MDKVKLAVIYYSSTGTNYQLSKWAEEGAIQAGAEVKVFKVDELVPQEIIDGNEGLKANADATKHIPLASSEDLVWADAIIFSIPTRFGTLPSQMKNFIDKQGPVWAQGKLTNKVVSAMCSASNPHGGQEGTIKDLYTVMMHWGAIIATPGYTDDSISKAGGNPYGTSVTQGADGKMVEDVKDAVIHQAKRTVQIASWIKKGQQ